MAALDFGMALARGMLPQSEKAQKDLMNLAGGRNIFKSEDWWNKAVDKQISKGYRTVERQDKEFLMPSGEYQPGQRQVSTTYGRTIMGQFSPLTGIQAYSYSPGLFGLGGGVTSRTTVSYKAPEGAVFTIDPKTGREIYTSRMYDVFGTKRKDYTASELKAIEKSAKAGAQRVKREVAQSETSQKRLTRGTGGLAAKAKPVGAKAETGLPDLGAGGLQLGATSLGKGLFV